MRIEWIIRAKPKVGFENRCIEIKQEISQLFDKLEENCLDSDLDIDMYVKEINDKINQLLQEHESITISKYISAKTPKLSDDKQIDQLIIDKYYKQKYKPVDYTIEDFYRDNFDKYFCEYSIEDSIGSVDLSGNLQLDLCCSHIVNSTILSKEIKAIGTHDMNPSTVNTLANMIEMETNHLPNSYSKDIFIKTCKWLRFWSSTGHSISVHQE